MGSSNGDGRQARERAQAAFEQREAAIADLKRSIEALVEPEPVTPSLAKSLLQIIEAQSDWIRALGYRLDVFERHLLGLPPMHDEQDMRQ
jgi:hypothetical protein